MSEGNKDLINQIKALNDNIDLLTKVTAVSIGKEAIFKGKEELGDKIEALDGLGIPDKIIALIIGSTSGSVQSIRSQKKAKSKKTVSTEQKMEETQPK